MKFFSEPIKNVILKPIESYKPRERCQASIVFFKLWVRLIKIYLYNDG